ncbi:hypothetical protein Tcan_11262 [Toxocara canis]|uniref:Uncharacterized protein n=1 Tax=Toxocara canis TaxID=6265 RepID=A0A0B2V3W9_TOXCA|nr:hypothetical protein Tcan_11262 [Toxocara canis]
MLAASISPIRYSLRPVHSHISHDECQHTQSQPYISRISGLKPRGILILMARRETVFKNTTTVNSAISDMDVATIPRIQRSAVENTNGTAMSTQTMVCDGVEAGALDEGMRAAVKTHKNARIEKSERTRTFRFLHVYQQYRLRLS